MPSEIKKAKKILDSKEKKWMPDAVEQTLPPMEVEANEVLSLLPYAAVVYYSSEII